MKIERPFNRTGFTDPRWHSYCVSHPEFCVALQVGMLDAATFDAVNHALCANDLDAAIAAAEAWHRRAARPPLRVLPGGAK